MPTLQHLTEALTDLNQAITDRATWYARLAELDTLIDELDATILAHHLQAEARK